jgi:hypothetical protein
VNLNTTEATFRPSPIQYGSDLPSLDRFTTEGHFRPPQRKPPSTRYARRLHIDPAALIVNLNATASVGSVLNFLSNSRPTETHLQVFIKRLVYCLRWVCRSLECLHLLESHRKFIFKIFPRSWKCRVFHIEQNFPRWWHNTPPTSRWIYGFAGADFLPHIKNFVKTS